MNIFELWGSALPALLKGLIITLESSLIALCIAAVLGLVFGFMSVSKSKILKVIARIYVDIIRGTPLIVQAFFIYFGITRALSIQMSSLTAGIIALSLNAGAYSAELFRAGIEAVPIGQTEAARSLGMPGGMAMRKVILPQAVRTMVPALVSQCIITIKDSSILSAIGLAELTLAGKEIIATTYQSFEIWLLVGFIYFVIIMILSKISVYIEGRLKYGKG